MYLEVLVGGGLVGARRVRVAVLGPPRAQLAVARARLAADRSLESAIGGVAAAVVADCRARLVDSFLSFTATYILIAVTLGSRRPAVAGAAPVPAMRIAFDGTTLRPGRTGVGYYTEHLLHHLAGAGGDDEIVVVSNRPVDTTRAAAAPTCGLPRSPVAAAADGVDADARRRGLLRQLEQSTSSHFTNGMVPLASPVPTVVTIHDMSLTLYPRYHPPRRVLLNRPLVDLAARRADAIITVSQSAKRDIVRLYGLPSERVHVVHEAAAPSFRPVHDLDGTRTRPAAVRPGRPRSSSTSARSSRGRTCRS